MCFFVSSVSVEDTSFSMKPPGPTNQRAPAVESPILRKEGHWGSHLKPPNGRIHGGSVG